jgi:MFS family permease
MASAEHATQEPPDPTTVPGGRNPLRIRAFRRIAAGYTVNELGNWVGEIALAILVFDQTGSPLATAALFLGLRFLPALVGPILTSRVESVPVRRVLPAIYLAEGAIFTALAWLTAHFSLPAVVLLGAVDGTLAIGAAALTRGATAALLLPDGSLRRGNSILNIGFSAGGAIGPALAGAMVGLFGVASALIADAATFVLVAAILATTRGLRLDRSPSSDWRVRLRAGLREAWVRPGVRRLLAAEAVAVMFFTAAVPIEVVYAKQTLGAGDSGYGALLACWGVGMVVGSVTQALARDVPLLRVFVLSIVLIGAGYAGIGLAPNLRIACLFSAVGGVGNGTLFITLVNAIQQSVSPTAQSSVMSIYAAINQLMPAIGFLLGGAITALGSPRLTYLIAAGGALVVLLIVAVRPPPGLDEPVVTLDDIATDKAPVPVGAPPP